MSYMYILRQSKKWENENDLLNAEWGEWYSPPTEGSLYT